MKKLLLIPILLVMVLGSSVVNAAERAPLGGGILAVKLDYIKFTEDFLKDADVDTGLYVGIEAYNEIPDVLPNLYVGIEVGFANPEGNLDYLLPGIGNVHIDTQTTFIPIELNLKYAIKAAPNFVVDFGAGASANYAKFEASVPAYGISADENDWLLGGQVFADLNYTYGRFFAGINGKYQATGDFEIDDFDTDVAGTNWRIGGQVGIRF